MHRNPLLIVNPDPHSRSSLVQVLGEFGLDAFETPDLESATRAIFLRGPFGAIICEKELPDGFALNFVHWLRNQVIATPVLILSDHGEPLRSCSTSLVSLVRPIHPVTFQRTLRQFGLLETAAHREERAA
jgi:DNA-binding NtrC family response regulator